LDAKEGRKDGRIDVEERRKEGRKGERVDVQGGNEEIKDVGMNEEMKEKKRADE
jgi:hypothetical protein